MPIVRDRRESLESETCMFNITYSEPDVRKALISLCRIWCADGLLDSNTTWSEQDLRYSLRKLLADYLPDRNAEYIGKWAFCLALRKKYVMQSVKDKNAYFVADMIVKKSMC